MPGILHIHADSKSFFFLVVVQAVMSLQFNVKLKCHSYLRCVHYQFSHFFNKKDLVVVPENDLCEG